MYANLFESIKSKSMDIKNIFHQARRCLAKAWLNINLQLTVVGVTGSYGKTSSVRAIAEVLSSKYSVNKTDLDLDTVYNLPISLLKTKLWDEVLVLEYGIDHKGEMDFHLELVKPKIAVLTGITPVHADTDHLGSLREIILEKTKLVESIPDDGLAIFNYDDQYTRKIGNNFKKRKIFYGLDAKADVWAENIKVLPSGTSFALFDKGKRLAVWTGLLGYPAVYTCLISYLVGQELKIKDEEILKKLEGLKPLPGRLSFEQGPLETMVLNDCLRANPASVIAGLKTFSKFSGRKIVVLGEMGELGECEAEMHKMVGKELSGLGIDYIVGVGPLARLITNEAVKNKVDKDRVFWAENVGEAAEILRKFIKKNDLIYLKASLLRHLERILLILGSQKVCCTKVVCQHYGNCSTCSEVSKRLK